MAPRTRRTLLVSLGVAAFAGLSFVAFRGYMTPEMMIYFLSFKWCL
jgi:hypothetical protein